MRHIIAILLQNEAGALSRVAGLFSTRGYNIESLSVAPTDDPTVSRLTLVTTGNDSVIGQILSQLRKLVDVVQVDDMTRGDHIERELLLLKLKVAEQQLEALTAVVTEAGGRILSGALANFVIELTSSEAQVSRFLAQASQRAHSTLAWRSFGLRPPIGVS
jgi:acetolactate synthase-1/3 small subunit